jgi:hypothetical protein
MPAECFMNAALQPHIGQSLSSMGMLSPLVVECLDGRAGDYIRPGLILSAPFYACLGVKKSTGKGAYPAALPPIKAL